MKKMVEVKKTERGRVSGTSDRVVVIEVRQAKLGMDY